MLKICSSHCSVGSKYQSWVKPAQWEWHCSFSVSTCHFCVQCAERVIERIVGGLWVCYLRL